MRCTVIMAVPDGASILASWCSSITSAVSKYGAASSAKRIISTAPMAKFGATRQLLVEKAAFRSSMSSAREAGGADDGVDAVVGAPAGVGAGGVERGEVDGHLDAASAMTSAIGGDGDARRPPRRRGRIDGGHQLEIGVAGHRRAHRGPHAAAGPEDPHADRHGPDPTVGPVRYGLSLPNVGSPTELVRLARTAEATGWDGVFLWDHLHLQPRPPPRRRRPVGHAGRVRPGHRPGPARRDGDAAGPPPPVEGGQGGRHPRPPERRPGRRRRRAGRTARRRLRRLRRSGRSPASGRRCSTTAWPCWPAC